MAGRPRTFDRDAALLIAMERFWRDGYDATTVAKLTSEMGITAPSLYAAFGDKDQLFDASASCYYDTVTVETAKALDRPTAREAVTDVMWMTAAAHTDSATPPGCFILTEPRLGLQRQLLTKQIAERWARGIAEGDVTSTMPADDVASFVVAVLAGMSARARDGGTRAEVNSIVELALAALPH